MSNPNNSGFESVLLSPPKKKDREEPKNAITSGINEDERSITKSAHIDKHRSQTLSRQDPWLPKASAFKDTVMRNTERALTGTYAVVERVMSGNKTKTWRQEEGAVARNEEYEHGGIEAEIVKGRQEKKERKEKGAGKEGAGKEGEGEGEGRERDEEWEPVGSTWK